MQRLGFIGLGCLFFLLMLTIPATYQVERGVILVVLCMAVVINGINSYWIVHRSIIIACIVCVFNSIVFVALGVINGSPGAMYVIPVYVLWPLVYILLMGCMRRIESHLYLIRVLVYGIIIASIMGFGLVADGFGLLPTVFSRFFELQGASVGLYVGKIEYSLLNTSTVIYGLPFLFALLMLPKGTFGVNPALRSLSAVALFLCCVSVLITGRRSLIVIAFLAPFITIIIFRLAGLASPIGVNYVLKAMFISTPLVLCVAYFLDINFVTIFDDFKVSFDFSDDSDRRSSSVRGEQFYALVDGWGNHPLFGHGHGSGTPSVVRDPDSPWAYELSYFALLYQVGIVGFSVYTLSIAWLYSSCLKAVRIDPVRAGILLPLLIGLSGFLLANATNPYLLKFDYLWTIFLPVSFLNVLLLSRKNG